MQKNNQSTNIVYKKLGELGSFFTGLSGLNKYNFNTGSNYYVPYVNIFKNLAIDTNICSLKTVDIGDSSQNALQVGDIVFTGSSELLEETGMSSVLIEPFEHLYLNSFCFGFRFDSSVNMHPGFTKYLFRSNNIRSQIIQNVNGVTRYNLSKRGMANVVIPVIPMGMQIKIANILDKLSKLQFTVEKELQSEQINRKKQYLFYRQELLSEAYFLKLFKSLEIPERERERERENSITYTPLRDVTIIDNHLRRPVRKDLRIPGNIPYYGANNIQDWVSDYGHDGEYVLVARCGSNDLDNYSIQYVTGKFVANDHVHVVKGMPHILTTKFLYFYLKSVNFRSYLNGNERAVLNRSEFNKILIPIIPLVIQKRLVSYLEALENFTNEISKLLPEVMKYYKQQYHYYLDHLVNFKS